MIVAISALVIAAFLIGYGLGGRAKDKASWKRGLFEHPKQFEDDDNPPGSL